MKISTRIRYGVRLMLFLAENWGKDPIFLKEIARAEEISEKYLSLIIIPLKAMDLVNSIRGAHGGYTLAKPPETITLKQIVEAIEGRQRLVDCVSNDMKCTRSNQCVTRDIWEILSDRINETLESITLKQLVLMKQDKIQESSTYTI